MASGYKYVKTRKIQTIIRAEKVCCLKIVSPGAIVIGTVDQDSQFQLLCNKLVV